MAAVVEYDEQNGASPGTVTHGITSARYGALDQVHLLHGVGPIVAGANSYEKWHRWHLVSLGGSVRIEKLRLFATSAPQAGDTHGFNGSTTEATYDGANHKQTSYATPATTSTRTPETVPTSDPGAPNIGVGGDLTGVLDADGEQSDYCVSQVRVGSGTLTGKIFSLTFAYEEVG